MDLTAIGTLISTVGFPIGMSSLIIFISPIVHLLF